MSLIGISAVASCVKVEQAPVREAAPITFQAVVGLAGDGITKAGNTDGAVYPTDMPFNTVAYYNAPANSPWDRERKEENRNIPAYSADDMAPKVAEVAYEAGNWVTKDADGKLYTWPLIGSLTFMAYSPAGVGTKGETDYVDMSEYIAMDHNGIRTRTAADTGGEAKFWDTENVPTKGVDFMVADIQIGKNANELNAGKSGVPIIFHHMLSKIKVDAVTSKGQKAKIHSVSISNVYTKGSYSATMANQTVTVKETVEGVEQDVEKTVPIWSNPSHRWTTTGAAQTITIYDSGNDTDGIEVDGTNLDSTEQAVEVEVGSCYAIPQMLSDAVVITIGYSVLNTETSQYVRQDPDISQHLSGFHENGWQRGMMYNYKIFIGLQKEIQFEGSSDVWNEAHEDEAGGAMAS